MLTHEQMYALAARRALLVLGALLFLSAACARAAWGSTPAAYDTVTVHAGDSVWTIAAQRYPAADTRDKVGEIMSANGLHDPTLLPGQHLKVPAG
jgi:nucleoid-associated protein YgaU